MSLEAWGDEGDTDSGFTDERMGEIGTECFRRGVQMCREMMARFVEQGGDTVTADSIRANWNPNWGADPGAPSDADYAQDGQQFDPFVCA